MTKKQEQVAAILAEYKDKPNTFGYWLEKFDEPLRTEVFEAIKRYKKDSSFLEKLQLNKSMVVSCGFVWSKSKKGYEYWNNIHEKLEIEEKKQK